MGDYLQPPIESQSMNHTRADVRYHGATLSGILLKHSCKEPDSKFLQTRSPSVCKAPLLVLKWGSLTFNATLMLMLTLFKWTMRLFGSSKKLQ